MYLGIEIGGTKLQLALGSGDGALADCWRGGVDVAAGAAGIRRQIEGALPELLTRAGVAPSALRGVGIGFGGPVDDATRTVIKSHQIEGWDHFPLADWVQDRFGLRAALGNDADVAGLGEALHGAGKGLSPIFYITIGSGIGGGLILDGEIYRGCGRGAAEIGHLRVQGYDFIDDAMVRCPLEEVASGWAIQEKARERLGDGHRESPMHALVGGHLEQLRAHHVAEASRQGDAVARDVLGQAFGHLAECICHVIALLCPRRIVIGGGVSLMGEDVLFQPLRALVAARVFRPFADCYDIVPAVLGEEVVLHGALALARRRFGER